MNREELNYSLLITAVHILCEESNAAKFIGNEQSHKVLDESKDKFVYACCIGEDQYAYLFT